MDLWPDVTIFANAVRRALEQSLFYEEKDFDIASRLLGIATARIDHLESGEAPWTQATGLVPRGYVSRLDGSVQP